MQLTKRTEAGRVSQIGRLHLKGASQLISVFDGRKAAMTRMRHTFAGCCLLLVCTTAQSLVADTTPRAVVEAVAPAYPDIVRAARVQGTVEVRVTVQPDGLVSAFEIASGHALFKNAVAVASQWRFVPAASESQEVLMFTFELEPPYERATTSPTVVFRPPGSVVVRARAIRMVAPSNSDPAPNPIEKKGSRRN